MAETGADANAEIDAANAAKYKNLKTADGKRPRFIDERIAAARLSEQKAIDLKEQQIKNDRLQFQPPMPPPPSSAENTEEENNEAEEETGEEESYNSNPKLSDQETQNELENRRISAMQQAPAPTPSQDQEPAEEKPSDSQIENNLGAKKSQAQNKKPDEKAELAGAALNTLEKQVKKRFLLWVLSAVGGFLGSTAIFWVPLLIISFTFVLTYMYWTNHKWELTLYWKAVTGDYAGLINNAINNTDAYGSTPAPKTTDTAKPAAPQSGPPPETAPSNK